MSNNMLNEFFTYHAPKADQVGRYKSIRSAGKMFAQEIMKSCPNCSDRSAAIRKVREAVMTANAAIAIYDSISQMDFNDPVQGESDA